MISENIVVRKFRECLESCLKSSEREGLELVSSGILEVLGKLDSPMQLAIIGKVSSSKSTLVNAILGKADVVGTGQMEKTYNVSWLKYGPSDGDVKAVLKDGSCKMLPRVVWESQDDCITDDLKDNVKYFEVTYDHEILKTVNIIDTPGLDSVKGTDSRNTVEFLRDVRPDAVIMLFTRGLADSTLSVVREFQESGTNSFSLSPLNAVGILSKIDYLWKVDDERRPEDKARVDVIEGNIYRLFPEVKNTLHTILPVCSMLGLAAHTVNDGDIAAFRKLVTLDDSVLEELLSDADEFLDSEDCLPDMVFSERKALYSKYGLYGIYEAVKFGKSSSLDRKSLTSLFMEVSGMGKFEDCLYSYFGQRRFLLKTRSAATVIGSACKNQRIQCKTESQRLAVDSIQSAVLSCLMGIFEYKQLDFLTKVYDNEMMIKDNAALEEFKRVCGEYDDSAAGRLGLSGNPSSSEMISLATRKSEDWNYEYQCSYHRSADDSLLYQILSQSYALLGEDIAAASERMAEAEKTIRISRYFMYGKQNCD